MTPPHASSVPDRVVNHGQSEPAAAKASADRLGAVAREITSEDVSAGGARLTKQWFEGALSLSVADEPPSLPLQTEPLIRMGGER